MHVEFRSLGNLAVLAAIGSFVACSASERQSAAVDVTPADTVEITAPSGARRIAIVGGFQTPEGVVYDAAADIFFVSNINGSPNAKDNNGFISRMRPDGVVDSLRFIAGGRNGVTLHAPKGMALHGDLLWVADIDAVHAFDRGSGAHVRTVDLQGRGAVFLNDLDVGPDGALYVTDTGIRFTESGVQHPGPDRIFRVTTNGNISVAVQGDSLSRPNGIAWNRRQGVFVIVPFGGEHLFTWAPDDHRLTRIARGPGSFDGVAVLSDGRILVSSWADSTVSMVTDSTLTPMVTGVEAPAAFGLDTRRLRIAVPLFNANRVEIWTIPMPR